MPTLTHTRTHKGKYTLKPLFLPENHTDRAHTHTFLNSNKRVKHKIQQKGISFTHTHTLLGTQHTHTHTFGARLAPGNSRHPERKKERKKERERERDSKQEIKEWEHGEATVMME